jgi:hypothetical protein
MLEAKHESAVDVDVEDSREGHRIEMSLINENIPPPQVTLVKVMRAPARDPKCEYPWRLIVIPSSSDPNI